MNLVCMRFYDQVTSDLWLHNRDMWKEAYKIHESEEIKKQTDLVFKDTSKISSHFNETYSKLEELSIKKVQTFTESAGWADLLFVDYETEVKEIEW